MYFQTINVCFNRNVCPSVPWPRRLLFSRGRRPLLCRSASTKLVIVESPAKVDKIKQFLGTGYDVIATVGHVRQIKTGSGSVQPDKDFSIAWDSNPKQQNSLKRLTSKIKSANEILLATDPDREGEAISWHVHEIMKQKKAINGNTKVERITFTEITKSAVKSAMNFARPIDQNLVNAYLARSVLDYLVGYTLSPVLWRKVKGCRSAGRVQSPALRLVVEREHEIRQFKPQEYWDFQIKFNNPQTGVQLEGKLTHFDGKKLQKFDVENAEKAKKVKEAVEKVQFVVKKKTAKKRNVQPPTPFKTSSLQQDAFQKFGLHPKQTMVAAQSLYENGLITYMRTDSTHISHEAVSNLRDQISSEFGPKFLPDKPNTFSNKAKNAQEAHEAIRITNPQNHPNAASISDPNQTKLYQLIWQRTLACQMSPAQDQILSIVLESDDGKHKASATATERVFEGWSVMYQVGDDEGGEEGGQSQQGVQFKTQQMNLLKSVKEGDVYDPEKVTSSQHFTQPPPRYNDASLVKALEQLGIGRPSTYAAILSVLKDRDYITSENRALKPTSKGCILSTFLTQNFHDYVDYQFTSRLEDQLDEISSGRTEWKDHVLAPFWGQLEQQTKSILQIDAKVIQQEMQQLLAPIYLQKLAKQEEEQESAKIELKGTKPNLNNSNGNNGEFKCPACSTGEMMLMVFQNATYFGCSHYKEGPCNYRAYFDQDVFDSNDLHTIQSNGSNGNGVTTIGQHPETNLEITLRQGPWGWYLQLGDVSDYPKGTKPKRFSLGKKAVNVADITLDKAVSVLRYPKVLGEHQGMEVCVNVGRFGPYVCIGDSLASIPKGVVAENVDLASAIDLLQKKTDSLGIQLGEATSKKKLAKKKTSVKTKSVKASNKTKTTEKKKKTVKKPSTKDQQNTIEGSRSKTTKVKKSNPVTKSTKISSGENDDAKKKRTNWQVFISIQSKEVGAKKKLQRSELMKTLGEMWRNLSDTEKKQYVEKD
eukprot:TRINITY_DN4081_c0_g1_i1.p1 TRINITY_DN4081_c0_g1~~TRINITY_DN4081_c0_g1_i1.p1  ORF type:complete len:999 (+),score=129.09 TRINITY_DN4081_c0_g1_i1:39-2999(+)